MAELATSLDGRRARRIANRDAVLEALLELLSSGHLTPSAAEIAERAGVSERSLFRYFDDLPDLLLSAVARFNERHVADFEIPVDPALPLADRITAVVDRVLYQREVLGGIAVMARARAPFQPILAEVLVQRRRFAREQLEKVFAPELDRLDPAGRIAVLVSVEVLCSFESLQLVVESLGSGLAGETGVEPRAVLVDALERQFAGI